MHTVEVSAWFLGSRLVLRELEPHQAIRHTPLTLAIAPQRWVVVFRFGVVVFFGFNADDEQEWLKRLSSRLSGVLEPAEHEATVLLVDPNQADSVNADGHLVVIESSVERIQIIAQVLAKSVVCWRRPKIDPVCRLKNDPGTKAVFEPNSHG